MRPEIQGMSECIVAALKFGHPAMPGLFRIAERCCQIIWQVVRQDLRICDGAAILSVEVDPGMRLP
jgi:hypothetical protein